MSFRSFASCSSSYIWLILYCFINFCYYWFTSIYFFLCCK